MNQLEKIISPFIAQQFPSFYREEGPNFIAFVKAYYEWLEQSGQIIHETRSLLEYIDIDLTSEDFIQHFKNTFIESLPENVVIDKRLLIKHVLDLYRSKGSERSYALLFRLVYGEDIELFIPSKYIFKPSDNKWKIPVYIETTGHPNIASLLNDKITTNQGATAVVESVDKKIIKGKTVYILSLTGVRGTFYNGDRIYQVSQEDVTSTDGPLIVGSMNYVLIGSGGSDYAVGDILNVEGSGIEGKAKVLTINNDNPGAINFIISDGGTGYSLDASVTVKQTIELSLANTVGVFYANDIITDTTTTANGTVTFSNSSFAQVIDRSTTLSFEVGDTVTSTYGTAVIENIRGGTGTGASFRVGGIGNKEILQLNTDVISPYVSTLLNASTWPFPNYPTANLTTGTIAQILNYVTKEVGTILYLSSVNPGSQYSTKPYVDVIEPAVASLNITDAYGNLKGHNAIIDTNITSTVGTITAVEVVDSGYGYLHNENVTLSKANNESVVIGVAIVESQGKGSGRWLNRNSFTSDIMKLQDSYFYQNFSYQIIAEKMLSTYEKLVRNLVHPSGLALYGKYRLNDEILEEESSLIESTIT